MSSFSEEAGAALHKIASAIPTYAGVQFCRSGNPPTWSASSGDVRTREIHFTAGGALIELAKKLNPPTPGEDLLRRCCDVLGLDLDFAVTTCGRPIVSVVEHSEIGDVPRERRLVECIHASRETACRAALSALDEFYPRMTAGGE